MGRAGAVRRAFRFFRVLGVTLAACGLIMGLSFLVTLSVVRERNADQRPPAYLVAQGEDLRIFNNELMQLGESFVAGVPKSAFAPAPSVRQWVDHSFLPKLRAFRVAVNRGESADAAIGKAFAAIYSASERLWNAAHRLGDAHARRSALQAVLEAGRGAEEVLKHHGVHRFLHTPPDVPRFREDS